MQKTLAKTVSFAGTGLHGGRLVRMSIRPAPANHGIVFVRTDLPDGEGVIAVCPDNWRAASLCTVLESPEGARVTTIEHVLAALNGCGVHNARIHLDSPEAPILDGSAAPFARAILRAGLREQNVPVRALRVLREVSYQDGAAKASLRPADALEITFSIAYAEPGIGTQSAHFRMNNGAFLRELSDCRTFCLRADVESMQQRGLALGGTLENAIVFEDGQVLTPGGLRRADEPVRHKMLDAMGDLYVAGLPLIGHYTGERAGHAVTGHLLQALLADPANFDEVLIGDDQAKMLPGAGISLADLPLTA